MTDQPNSPASTTILVLSTERAIPPVLDPYERDGTLVALMDHDLSERDIDRSTGLITTIHLDQIRFHELRPAIDRFFRRGGRLFFNGHPVRRFVDGLTPFVPLDSPRRRDLDLSALTAHPVFAGIDTPSLATRKGVAGFFGRGHAPPPPGAAAVTGLGPNRWPVDWTWDTPAGGTLFIHAGNDLWSVADDPAVNARLAGNIIQWVTS
ncbi:hypothetical protein [Fodinicurvata sp. EGI_FJ10296]|uniref:hypothetical protein n=1 Tax=Fodinicurvata sp. EGI_FJ10296 TaxID=3231908 RepID=UPI003453CD60